MAQRPIFLPQAHGTALVQTTTIEFDWHAGMSLAQKQKSITSLHIAAQLLPGVHRPLEVSSKSSEPLGVALSAFNLTLPAPTNGPAPTVECTFQSSKVFEHGGPFTDLLAKTSREAKTDPRLQSSGRLICFRFYGVDWPLEPPTVFYDWLYISALLNRSELLVKAAVHDAFTDIEFNPTRSINCQAYSLALACALQRRGLLKEATASPDAFIHCVRSYSLNNAHRSNSIQGSLL